MFCRLIRCRKDSKHPAENNSPRFSPDKTGAPLWQYSYKRRLVRTEAVVPQIDFMSRKKAAPLQAGAVGLFLHVSENTKETIMAIN